MKIKKRFFILILLLALVFLIAGSTDSFAVQPGTRTNDINGIEDAKYPGFKTMINNLKAKYPNFNFEVYYTGLDWNQAINGEYQDHGYSPLNLFTVGQNYGGMWYCPICGEKRFDNGSLCCASREAIMYMMDPRNSLNESDVFQFTNLEGSDVSYEDIARVVQGKGAFLNNPEAIQAIYDASLLYNINGYFLVAKIINEHGNNGTTLTAGRGYNGNYVGCYNYFNVGSYGNGTAAIINNGLRTAKNNGWTSIRASILGGSKILKENYMDRRRQTTLYYQKFNVVYQEALFSYQYQANIMAAQSQGASLKRYYGDNVSSRGITFVIPLFENMPQNACPRPKTSETNRINYEDGVVQHISTSLTVRAGESKSALAIGKLNNNESIKILKRATNKVDGYFWDMIVSNQDGTFGYAAREIGGEVVLASKGSTGTSAGAEGVPGSDPEPTPAPAPTPTPTPTPSENGDDGHGNVANVVLVDNSFYLSAIADYSTFKNKFEGVVVKDLQGNVVSEGKVGTGFTAIYQDKTYNIIKKGDTSCDGVVDMLDLIQVLNHLKLTQQIKDNISSSADVSGDGSIDMLDLIKILNYLKFTGTINV